QGNCVIVGRGAPHLLPPETTLRVRLVGDLPDRIAALGKDLGVSPEEAARQAEKLDRERDAFVRRHFHKDPAGPQHYDLLLNSSRFSVAECAELIIEALRRLQARGAGQK